MDIYGVTSKGKDLQMQYPRLDRINQYLVIPAAVRCKEFIDAYLTVNIDPQCETLQVTCRQEHL